MNPKAYIDELESLNEDIEPGLLSGLCMNAPDNLHLSVMSEIRNEKKKKFYMNYKIYMPVAAAVLVITMLLNGGQNYISQLYAEKPVEKEIVTPQGQITVTPPVTDNVNGDKTTKASAQENVSPKVTNITPSSKSTVNSSATALQTKKPATAGQSNTNAAQNTSGKTIAMNTDTTAKDIAAITEDDSNVDFEIVADSQSEVIDFLKTYGLLIDDGKYKLYKLNISYINQLNSIFDSGTAEGRLINGKISESEEFVIRLVING